jgi:20S proteasome alpha/beta subunit
LKTVGHLYKNIVYNNKNFLSGTFLVANATGIVQVDPSGGLHYREGWASSGSGGSYVRSILSNHYKENMTAAQAMEMVEKCMKTAIKYDKSSGGCIRMYNLCEDKTMEYKFLDFYKFSKAE